MWPFGKDSGKPEESSIPFIHKVSNRTRSVSIKIDRTGQVIVVSPRLVPKLFLNQFVEKHRDWIEKKLTVIKAARKNKDAVYIFGKAYQKRVTYLKGKPLGVIVVGSEIIANTPEAATQDLTWGKKQDQQLARFLKSTASTYIVKRTAQLAKLMDIKYGSLTLREQSSRWGSCSSRGNLNFNWRLIHAETPIIDYVLVHELAHRVHMDHSRNFWALVAKYDPEYQVHRGYLKRQGHGLY